MVTNDVTSDIISVIRLHRNAAAMAHIPRGLQGYVQGVEMVGRVTRSGNRGLTPIEIASAGPEEHFQRAP